MAASAVSFLINKLGTLIDEEVNLLGGVHREIRSIKDELEIIRSFLRDADRRKELEDGVMTWVKQVRDVAYDIEDVLDDFMLRMSRPRQISLNHLKARRQIAIQIQDIKLRLQSISERQTRYNLRIIEGMSSSGVASSRQQHQGAASTSLYFEEADIVGIEKARTELVRWLVHEESRLTVISVMGMGGLGKTTLAKKVYKSDEVKKHFEFQSWVSISQSFKLEEVVRSMIKSLLEIEEAAPKDLDKMYGIQLHEMLYKYLQGKRYCVVLDDVWGADTWNGIEAVLPNNNCGSRIMVTTRIANVASPLGYLTRVYHLQPLLPEAAWDLFCKKAFESRTCPMELTDLSREIVGKCRGLPLAIVAIGGLLLKKNQEHLEWKKVHDTLNWELNNNPTLQSLRNILSLSYKDLPYHLKYCFLYFSVFPEDYLIKRKRLVRLWVAEGFLKKMQGMTVEEVAENYLKELTDRSMIQVAEMDVSTGVRSYRIHDLMREMALLESEMENFSSICLEKDVGFEDKTRRLSVYNSVDNLPHNVNMSRLRSFSMFGIENLSHSSIRAILSRFSLLRVLDLERAPIESMPSGLFNLLHLKYLGLEGTLIKTLPESLSKLRNLETLDIRETYIVKLPIGISKLEHLRHLLVFRIDRKRYFSKFYHVKGAMLPSGIGNLSRLQNLALVEVDGNKSVVEELGRLTQLRSLEVSKLKREDGSMFCTSIQKMIQLLELGAWSIAKEEPLDVQTLSPPPLLQDLSLHGILEKVPCWISSLTNLTDLHLGWSRLTEDPLLAIENLPNLIRFTIFKAYDGIHLHCTAKGYKRLKVLEIRGLSKLKLMTVEKGAMPDLQELSISHCSELEEVPSGIQYLTSLKQLLLRVMHQGFIQNLRMETGGLHHRVRHIPVIKHMFQVDGKLIHEILS